jgi:hypothetical protein
MCEAHDPPGARVLGEVTGDALRDAIERLEVRDEGFEDEWLCACEPVYVYEIYNGRRLLTAIEFHGVGHMTLRGVEAIFDLAHGDAIEHWLAARGITDPRLNPPPVLRADWKRPGDG